MNQKSPLFFSLGILLAFSLFFSPRKFPGSVFSLSGDARMEETDSIQVFIPR